MKEGKFYEHSAVLEWKISLFGLCQGSSWTLVGSLRLVVERKGKFFEQSAVFEWKISLLGLCQGSSRTLVGSLRLVMVSARNTHNMIAEGKVFPYAINYKMLKKESDFEVDHERLDVVIRIVEHEVLFLGYEIW